MAHLILPLVVASLVFIGTWCFSRLAQENKSFEVHRRTQPRSRPVLSRPIVLPQGP